MSNKSGFQGVAGEAFKPKLTAEMIKTENVVLTIARAFKITIIDQGTGEVKEQEFAVEFAEFPEHTLRCSKTQGATWRALVAAGKLPDNFNPVDESWDWEGLSVPLYKKEVEYNKEKFLKLFPCSAAAFDEALATWPTLTGKKAAPNNRKPVSKSARNRR